MNKRKTARVALIADVTYESGGTSITKRVSDISEGGVFIDTPVPSETGTELRLRFNLDDQIVEASGRVAFSQPFIGMGVAFTSLPEAGRQVIRAFVARHASQPVGV